MELGQRALLEKRAATESQLLFEKINEKTSSAKLSKVTLLSPPFQETPPCIFLN